MKSEIKEINSCQKEVLIEISLEEFNPFFERAKTDSFKNLKIDGFRQGQVPESIAKNYLNEGAILETATQQAVKHFYFKFIVDNNIEAIGGPEITITKLAKDNPLEFKASFFVLPSIKLPDYKKIAKECKKDKVVVEDKEIEDTIKWIQRSRSETTPKNGPAQLGDFIDITHSSPIINNGQEDKEQLVIGQSHLLPDFEKELIGLSENQTKEFTITFPNDYFNKELAGKQAFFKILVHKVHTVKMPEITDDWAKTLGKFENLEQLKTGIKEGILKEKQEVESQKTQAQILDKIAKECECEVPQILLDSEKQRAVVDFKQRIPEMLKMSFEDYLKQTKLDEKGFAQSLIPEIKEKIKKSLILKEIKSKENVLASETEINEEANKFLERFKNEEDAENKIDPDNLKEYAKERIENKKTLELLENLAQ